MCDIDAFVSYYRGTMGSTFIPKLHMLEDHVVPFIRQWRVGVGMLGEQGVEGIHARFNTLERTYSSMSNRVERLKCVVSEHWRQVCPANVALQPPVQKRMKRDKD